MRLLGLGREQVVYLTSDAHDRLEPAALQKALESDPSSPTIVLLQAGDINIGAFDDFEALIPLAKRYGAWVHVDGAFGLWTVASPHYQHLVKGVEAADSWATDGHKWLNVPLIVATHSSRTSTHIEIRFRIAQRTLRLIQTRATR